MSHCRQFGPKGKDKAIFATREDHMIPSKVKLPEIEPQPGLLLPNGDLNWNCPCLGGTATGPCGVEFRDAFTCFHHSEADPPGADCYELFKKMENCMKQFPTLYSKEDDDDDGDFGTTDAQKTASTKLPSMQVENAKEEDHRL